MKGLRAEGIRMVFGGVVALDGAGVAALPGSVLGLIGRNGSGKSTLFNCISGFLPPTEGRITLDGDDLTGAQPHRIVGRGIARTFQTPRVDLRTTVRDAVRCGLYPSARSGFLATALGLPSVAREELALQRRADDVLRRLALEPWADAEIGTLSMGRVRLVEVARALASGARYLLLDEPAAGVSRDEQAVLAREIRALAGQGIGVLLVEHNFSLIRMLCDRVTVLDAGKVICEGTPSEVERDPQVLSVYLGSAADVASTAPTSSIVPREAAVHER